MAVPQNTVTHTNTVGRSKNFCVDQVTPPPPRGKDKGWGRTGGGGKRTTGRARRVGPALGTPKADFKRSANPKTTRLFGRV